MADFNYNYLICNYKYNYTCQFFGTTNQLQLQLTFKLIN